MELDGASKPGTLLSQVLGEKAVRDLLLDIGQQVLLPIDRDCWGHYGMAREFAAVFRKPFKDRF